MTHTETLQIPTSVRNQVDDRDQGVCRFCGITPQARVIHHIRYGGDDVGVGGRRNHDLGNLITLCGPFDNDCHSIVHADKQTWQPILIALTRLPTVTALQYRRWAKRRNGHRP